MARIFPFTPYRYAQTAGPLGRLVTQPYDKIYPDMRARYLALSPYNLVRVILGESKPSDNGVDNVYTRAAAYLEEWIAKGVLVKESEPSLYAYFQEFVNPDSGERLVRKGFIGLGALEEYPAGIVYRHEQTLAGPKKDRMQLLKHTHAHFGQLFMLYADPQREIDGILDQAAQAVPTAEVDDEYGVKHSLWKISDAATVERIQQLMSDKKLLIADGHHRYETALAFYREHPQLSGAQNVMMTFVNMHSPGLKILATHRLVSKLKDFSAAAFLERAGTLFEVRRIDSLDTLQHAWQDDSKSVIGAAIGSDLYALEARDRGDGLDIRVLHEQLLGKVLGITEEAVRNESFLKYVRGLEAAIAAARDGSAQIAFLLKPTSIEQVASISFGGGVMPQKSTDFYPKLLSGLTIYKVEK